MTYQKKSDMLKMRFLVLLDYLLIHGTLKFKSTHLKKGIFIMVFTNKLAQTLSGLALALAFSNAAHASIVEYNFYYSSGGNSLTVNFFVDDTINVELFSNITSASYTVNGTTYGFTPSPGARFAVDGEISPGFTGYAFAFDTDDDTGISVQAFSGIYDAYYIYFVDKPNLDILWVNTGTLTKVTAPSATAVPEPEAYAMMLAGLGLVGFAARRKFV